MSYWTNLYKNSNRDTNQVGCYPTEQTALAYLHDEWCSGGDLEGDWEYCETVFIQEEIRTS